MTRPKNMRPDDWRAVVAANPDACAADLARITGKSKTAVSLANKRLGLGLKDARSARAAERMRRLNQDPEFAAARDERMRRLNQDPEFAAARDERMRRLHQDPDRLMGWEAYERKLIDAMDDEAVKVFLSARDDGVGLSAAAELAQMDMQKRGCAT